MKVFVDTNIIMDFITARIPFGRNAKILFELGKEKKFDILVADLSFFTSAYSLKKYDFTKEDILDCLTALLPLVSIVPVGQSVVTRSLKKRGKDFEDDAQYFSAIDANADFIITRNKKDFPQEDFILEPKEFLALMNITY